MDIEKLIDTLKQHGVSCVRSYGKYCSICDEAATALSTLQAENEKLLDENRRWSESTRTLSCAIENLRDELNDLKTQWDMYGGDEGITAAFAERDQARTDCAAAEKNHADCAEELEKQKILTNFYNGIADGYKEELEKRQSLFEQVKRERDAAVERLREWEKFDIYLLAHNFLIPEKWCGIQKED